MRHYQKITQEISDTLDQLFHQQIWNLQGIIASMSNFNFVAVLCYLFCII